MRQFRGAGGPAYICDQHMQLIVAHQANNVIIISSP